MYNLSNCSLFLFLCIFFFLCLSLPLSRFLSIFFFLCIFESQQCQHYVFSGHGGLNVWMWWSAYRNIQNIWSVSSFSYFFPRTTRLRAKWWLSRFGALLTRFENMPNIFEHSLFLRESLFTAISTYRNSNGVFISKCFHICLDLITTYSFGTRVRAQGLFGFSFSASWPIKRIYIYIYYAISFGPSDTQNISKKMAKA